MKIKSCVFSIFLLVFLGDFFFGTYQDSPLSFLYSFIFIGSILSQLEKPYVSIFFPLIGSHIILAYFTFLPIFPIGLLIGILITPLFSILFPIFLIIYLFNLDIFHFLVLYIQDLIIEISTYYDGVEAFYSSIPMITTVVILSTNWNSRAKLWTLIFCCFFHSSPILNLRPIRYSKSPQNNFQLLNEQKGIKKIIRSRVGYRIDYTNGLRCYHKINNYFIEKYCRW